MERVVDALSHQEDPTSLPPDLVHTMNELSVRKNDPGADVHARYAGAAYNHYRRLDTLPPPNIHRLILWEMAKRPRSTTRPDLDNVENISAYVIRELFMLKDGWVPPPPVKR